jgi:murein L,D-transpeptidase YcbB/YkuD
MVKRPSSVVLLLACFVVFLAGCRRQDTSSAIASQLENIATTGRLSDLRWPDFSDMKSSVQNFYGERGYAPAWVQGDSPTQQANQLIHAFQTCETKGLNPEDYDNSRWGERLQRLTGKSKGDAEVISKFDIAMTVAAMRYISALHNGRVNPKHFNFGIRVRQKQYDLAQFLAQQVVSTSNLQDVLQQAEPDSDTYRKTENELSHYLELAKQHQDAPLPDVSTAILPGGQYSGVQQLRQRLQLLGDLPAAGASATEDRYDQDLANAVKRFQHRHGLKEDGRLTPETINALNTPLWTRVHQIQDALERWRWLPDEYLQAPIEVNLPEFVLRAYGPNHQLEFKMNVVVGESVQEHQTPVFTDKMTYLIFRPYWKVPKDIAAKEILPHVEKNKHYLSEKNFEVADPQGDVVEHWTNDDIISGKLMIREKPGPKNSLGLAKFMFPNQYDVYLHGTPATELFAHTRRDFSHGCIRVQDPAKLAAWLLQGQPEWPMDKIQDAMNNGPENQQLGLKQPRPVVIFYVTAIVDEDGSVHFFDDIYGYDRQLEAALAKGYPYTSPANNVSKRPASTDTR